MGTNWAIRQAALVAAIAVAVSLSLATAPGADGSPDAKDVYWHVWEFVGRVLGADDVKNEATWPVKFALMFLTLLGLVLVGAVVASLTEVVGSWMRRLQRGRSQVMERGHTIIAGWTSNTPVILRELIEANRSEGGRPIVVVGDVLKGWSQTRSITCENAGLIEENLEYAWTQNASTSLAAL